MTILVLSIKTAFFFFFFFFFYPQILLCSNTSHCFVFLGYGRRGFSQFLEFVMCDVSASFSSKILLIKVVLTTVVGWKSALYPTAIK